MGIPSFYRHLCKKYPAIIAKGASSVAGSEWLCLDFNCAMYWVLRKMRPLSDNQYVWEGELCEAIAAYMKEIIQEVRPTKGVFVSCDGVVCAAKRRQQRLRRFKGPWIAAAEGSILGKSVNSGWDQNALTPGSAFMKRLGDVLTATGALLATEQGIRVTVSTTSEPGEGEHKLLAAMRRERPASCVIYGLDADLILLSLLLMADTGATVSLLRETQEFERGGGRDGDGGWRTLSVNKLKDAMFPAGYSGVDQIRDFVAGMSLLGNDFLPHSLTRTVRDEGIPQLLRVLQQDLWNRGTTLVSGTNGKIRREGMMTLLRAWAAVESGDMFMAVLDAYKASRYSVGEGETPQETALREWNALPARWASITRLLASSRKDLVAEWKDIYRNVWGGGGAEQEYLQGVAWVWDYYSGHVVDQSWNFDNSLPPLWCDLVSFLENQTAEYISAPTVKYPDALPEWLHLLSVLPVDSVRRLLPKDKHRLMLEHPWFWPASWKLFDVGRHQMWECEPMIPLIPEALLRATA